MFRDCSGCLWDFCGSLSAPPAFFPFNAPKQKLSLRSAGTSFTGAKAACRKNKTKNGRWVLGRRLPVPQMPSGHEKHVQRFFGLVGLTKKVDASGHGKKRASVFG